MEVAQPIQIPTSTNASACTDDSGHLTLDIGMPSVSLLGGSYFFLKISIAQGALSGAGLASYIGMTGTGSMGIFSSDASSITSASQIMAYNNSVQATFEECFWIPVMDFPLPWQLRMMGSLGCLRMV